MVSLVAAHLTLKSTPLMTTAEVDDYRSFVRLCVQIGMVVVLIPWTFCKAITKTTVANYVGLTCIFFIVVVSIVFSDVSNAPIGDEASNLWPSSGKDITLSYYHSISF
jgi:hypothetical protein